MIPRHLQITFIMLLIVLLAGGIYMYQLKRRDERNAARTAEQKPVTAPVTGPATRVKLAVAYDDDGVIATRDVEVPLPKDESGRAREVVRALLAQYTQKPSPHAVADGSDVRAVYMVADGLCVLNMNAPFADGHRSGVLLEQMTVATVVETLGTNLPSVRKVKFLIEGKDRETLAGHADLNMVYDVAAVHALVQGLAEQQ
jgi:spore germination protein GerM